MAEEEKKEFKLFRERSLEAIESPESLNDYLRVTSPGVWLILAAVIVVLTGAVLWGIFGRINTSVNVAVVTKEGEYYCVVPYDQLQGVMSSGIVTVEEQDYAILLDGKTETVIISEGTNPYIRVSSGLKIGDVAVKIPVEPGLSEGVYTGTVVTESLQPISLLLQ